MTFKNFIQISFICIITVNLYGNNLSIFLLCKKKYEKKLQSQLGGLFKISDSLNESDLIICDKNYIDNCLKLNKKIILINIYSYEINRYKNKNIVAFFPIDCPLKYQTKFLNKTLRNVHKKCVITHYKRKKLDDVVFYYVKNIGEVPYKLNLAIKNCDIIIALPDDIVFNYFSTRFIFKNIILKGKLIVGYTKKMIDLGAIYSFEINYDKYIEKIKNFLKNFKKKYKEKSQFIIEPELNDFKIYSNLNILK